MDLSSTSSDSPPADGGDGGNQGTFPHKTPAEIALGDAMAAFSAILYGVYTIVMKKQVGDESRVNMQLFFGLVGLFNVLLLWPGFLVMHLTGIEPFALPDTDRVWTIVLVGNPPKYEEVTIWDENLRLISLFLPGQLRDIPRLRHLLGIRHAPDHAAGRHRRPQPHHPALPRGPDDPAGAVREPAVLGRRRDRVPVIHHREPREQGAGEQQQQQQR